MASVFSDFRDTGMRVDARPPPSSSEAEREGVRQLAADGLSIRRIAAVVFGDARYRGRVERILRRADTLSGAANTVRRPRSESSPRRG